MSIDAIQSIFRTVFEDDDLLIFPEMSAKDVDGWDSFNHINLIVSLEEAFSITFSTDEISKMANVGALVTILQQRGAEVSWPS